MSDIRTLYRIGIRLKETDKRKNATCYEYVVLAHTLVEAKAIAVAAHAPVDAELHRHRMNEIAAVGGYAMGVVYNSDIYSSRTRDVLPETLPSAEQIAWAREYIAQHDGKDEDENATELTKR